MKSKCGQLPRQIKSLPHSSIMLYEVNSSSEVGATFTFEYSTHSKAKQTLLLKIMNRVGLPAHWISFI